MDIEVGPEDKQGPVAAQVNVVLLLVVGVRDIAVPHDSHEGHRN